MKLKDQVAIITGAGRNIGEETAKLLAAEGARIAVVDMDRGRADKVAAEIKATGGDAAGLDVLDGQPGPAGNDPCHRLTRTRYRVGQGGELKRGIRRAEDKCFHGNVSSCT